MPTQQRPIMNLVDLLAVIFLLLIAIALLLPAISSPRESARRAACVNNMKQLGLALHNFHDARKRFPGAMNTPWGPSAALVESGPWGTPPEPASPAFDDDGNGRIDRGNGWSWTVMILPYMEEGNLYKRLRIADGDAPLAMPWRGTPGPAENDRRFTARAIEEIEEHKIDPGKQLSPWVKIPGFRCPSMYGGDTVIPPAGLDAYGPYDASNPEHEPVAVSNYACLGASHFPSLLKDSRLNSAEYEGTGTADAVMHPNGTMYPGSDNGLRDIKDGTSNTILLCETREERYSAWFDGAVGCLVGLVSPETGPSLEGPPAASFIRGGDAKTPYGNVKTTGPGAVSTYLNYGEEHDNTGKRFYTRYKTGNRIHGPSSEHPGVINHLFADGQVKNISEDLDANVYFHLITRRGGEPVEEY